jgi:hypothetical protein
MRVRDPQIALELLEDIDEGRGMLNPIEDRKTEPVRLTGSMIRVLSEDHHADIGERGVIESSEDPVTGRIHRMPLLLLLQKILQAFEVRSLEFLLEQCLPILTDPWRNFFRAAHGIAFET